METPSLRPVCGALAIACLAAATTTQAGDIELPEHAPIPQTREDALRQSKDDEAKPKSAPLELPKAEKECRQALRALGVTFAPVQKVEAEGGCALPYPIEVTALSPTLGLEPAAVLNCETARAAARLFQAAGMEAAQKHFDARLTGIRQDSAYVCRPINGLAKLSEHAFGNALDIAGFNLSDDREVNVLEHKDEKSAEAKFLNDIRAAACGVFSTVLGPGTNADHATHFHFDMKKRRTPYCR